MYDLLGNLVYKEVFVQRTVLHRKELPVGLYLIKIADEMGISYTRKIALVD